MIARSTRWTREAALAAVAEIDAARSGAELLGPDPLVRYEELMLLIHPDRLGGDERPLRRLQQLRDEVLRPASAPASASRIKMRVAGKDYVLTDRLARGEVADVYAMDGDAAVAKVCGPGDADLLEAEAAALRAARPAGADRPLDQLLPRLHASFALRTPEGLQHVNVIDRAEAGSATLARVREVYPAGVDYRDAAWMMRRLYAALGVAHSRGRVHGQILPEHVLVHPTSHRALLVGWCGSVDVGQPARLRVADRADFYPHEVSAGAPLTPATDLHMAAVCFMHLLGGTSARVPAAVPRQIADFIAASLIRSAHRRPSDALELHDILGDVMQKLVGPPTYRPLAMPAT